MSSVSEREECSVGNLFKERMVECSPNLAKQTYRLKMLNESQMKETQRSPHPDIYYLWELMTKKKIWMKPEKNSVLFRENNSLNDCGFLIRNLSD